METRKKRDPRHAAEMKLFRIQMLIAKGEGREPGKLDLSFISQMGQGRILTLLTMQPEISQQKLTYLIGTSRQAMSEMLSKLEEKEFIERVSSEEDKRKVKVRITKKGIKEFDELKKRKPEPKISFDDFSDTDMEILNTYLDRIISSLKAKQEIEDEAS